MLTLLHINIRVKRRKHCWAFIIFMLLNLQCQDCIRLSKILAGVLT